MSFPAKDRSYVWHHSSSPGISASRVRAGGPLTTLLLIGCLLVGLASQRLASRDALRAYSWSLAYWTLTPTLVYCALATVELDLVLARALAAAAIGAYLTIGLSYAYARAVSREREVQAVLTLAGSIPNVTFVGLPLTQLMLGDSAVPLAVLYGLLAWLVPPTALTVPFARRHARFGAQGPSLLRDLLINPPLIAALIAVTLRLTDLKTAAAANALSEVAYPLVGPVGLLLLGMALPLGVIAPSRTEAAHAAGAMAVRFIGGPLLLLAADFALRADVPAAFYFIAAMPCGFHIMTLSRVFNLRPRLMRLLVVSSNLVAVAFVIPLALLIR